MEPIISLSENLTTNSELSENCWPDFLKKEFILLSPYEALQG